MGICGYGIELRSLLHFVWLMALATDGYDRKDGGKRLFAFECCNDCTFAVSFDRWISRNENLNFVV